MFKIIKQLLAVFSAVVGQVDNIKKLINDFEKSYEDGTLTFEELAILLAQLIRILRNIFPSLRK